MTTKRMKKLLMGMGLSRNQATRMIQEQRTEGSKDVSNALYFHVFQKDFNLIVSSCGAGNNWVLFSRFNSSRVALE